MAGRFRACSVAVVMLQCACAVATTDLATEAGLGEGEPPARKERSPNDLAARVRRIADRTPEAEQSSLLAGSSCTDAMAAAWSRVLVTARATPPESVPRKLGKAAIARFCGFIEGRLRASPPGWWERLMAQAHMRQPERLVFAGPQDPVIYSSGTRDQATLRRQEEEWIVAYRDEMWRMPCDRYSELFHRATVVLDADRVYVTVYKWPATPYLLHALDRATGKELWRNQVWATGGLRNYSGMGKHRVDLELCVDNVVVFGGAADVLYVEAFDARTGTATCRFSTSYFEDGERPK